MKYCFIISKFALGRGLIDDELPYYLIAKILVEHGANMNVKDENNWTPLHFAAYGGIPYQSRLYV